MEQKLTPHILPILIWPDERLHQRCEDVNVFGRELDQIILNMVATMKARSGIGLAAPQVGILKNVIVLQLQIERDVPLEGTETPQTVIEDGPLLVFVNPRIVELDDKKMYTFEEGCLSVPGYFEKRKRPQRIVLAYKDAKGNDHETEFQGLYAFAIQHELDHLEGKVFVDGVSSLKANRIKSKIKKTLKRR